MAVAFQSKSELAWVDSDGENVTNPSGLAGGDLMVMFIDITSASDNFITPSGWTLIRKRVESGMGAFAVYWKIATGQDVSNGFINIDFLTSVTHAVSLTRITGHSPNTPIVASADADPIVSGTAHALVMGVTPVANCMFMAFAHANNDVNFTTCTMDTSDPGFTLDTNLSSVLGADETIGAWHSAARSQSTGTGNINITTDASVGVYGAFVAIQPPVSSVSPSPSSSISPSPSVSVSASLSPSPSFSQSPSSSVSASPSPTSSPSSSISPSSSVSASNSPSKSSSVSLSASSSASPSPAAWANQTKHSSSFNNQSKTSTSWNNQVKNG